MQVYGMLTYFMITFVTVTTAVSSEKPLNKYWETVKLIVVNTTFPNFRFHLTAQALSVETNTISYFLQCRSLITSLIFQKISYHSILNVNPLNICPF